MNRSFKGIIAAISLGMIFGVFAAGETNGQPINIVLSKMDKHYKVLSSLKSNLRMDKFNSQLGERDIFSGTVIMLPKTVKRSTMYARIDWAKPRVENLSIIKDSYTLYIPKQNQVYVGKTSKAQKGVPTGALDFMSMSRADLKDNYEIKTAGDEHLEDGTVATHLLLTPKKASNYKLAEIWVDVDGMVRFAKLTEKNSDTTAVLLSNIEKNKKIDAKAFTIKYPKTAKVVKG